MKEKSTPSFAYSLLILFSFAAFLVIGMRVLGAPLNVVMFLAWMLLVLLSLKLGYTYSELEGKAIEAVQNGLKSILIMLAVGALIAVFAASGTVPTIIYYGIKLMNPRFYLLSTLILCSIVSLCTGTSWGTIGTVGVALLCIGSGLGIPAGITGGAIISGAWFGDKLSPLSDTTNFASAVMGVDLMTHVKHMLYTTVPAYIVSAIIYLVIGFKVTTTHVDFQLINEISLGLASSFKISVFTLIPMIVVVVMLLMRKDPVQSILSGVIVGIFIAIFYQGVTPEFVFNSCLKGYSREFDNELLTKLLNDLGGMNSMNSTIQLIILTMGIGGMIKELGFIKVIASKFSQKIKSVGGLVAATIGISYLSIGLTGSHCFSAIMVETTMKDVFKSKGLKPENLSRVCEDCGTIGVTIIPWGVTAVFIINTLKIPFAEYAPYAFFCYLCPIFSLLCGITGIGMAKYTKEELLELETAK